MQLLPCCTETLAGCVHSVSRPASFHPVALRPRCVDLFHMQGVLSSVDDHHAASMCLLRRQRMLEIQNKSRRLPHMDSCWRNRRGQPPQT